MTKEQNVQVFNFNGVSTNVDDNGFVLHPEEWSRHMAEALAAADGVTSLTGDHWKVMNYVRDYWQDHSVAPMVRQLCRETGFSLTQIYEMFPKGPARGVCKYAGLPKPDGCV
jgi:dissimilatory sulfite reductase related protein